MNELTAYTWATLATISGATAATLLIVQYTKEWFDRLGNVRTRWIVLLIAFLILLGAQAFTAGIALTDLPLIAVNAFMVALAAMGAYEATYAKTGSKEPPDNPDNPDD